MSDNKQQEFPDELNHIYATLNQHDVEQFYAGYQLWYTRQRITTLQEQIGGLHQQISENAERLQQVQPPAVAFATLARLQANGVNEIELLDRMLERGEEWLDLTMQRLDYCEQLDFIHDNYAQWCEHALEGAYDWIDSMRDAYDDTMPQPVVTTEVDEVSVEATEELLLRKLTSEEEEEVTLKQPAVSLSPSVPAIEETPPEPGLQASPEEEPVTALETQEAGSPQGLPLQGPEMAFPVQADAEADSSLVSSEQADAGEYVEFAPALEARTEEAGSPQGPEMSFPIQADAEADSPLISSEQADEGEYVEFVPPSVASLPIEANTETDLPQVIYDAPQELEIQLPAEEDTEADSVLTPAEEASSQEHAELISTPETSLLAEATPTADASPAPVDQITSLEHVEPIPLSENSYLDTSTGMELAATDVEHEEPIPSKVDTTHNQIDVQVSIPEYRELPAQEVKRQRERTFWRRLLAIFWP